MSVGDKFCSVCGAKVDWQFHEVDFVPTSPAYSVADSAEGRGERPPKENERSATNDKRCPLCGFENPPDSRFCDNCGGRIGGARELPSAEVSSAAREGQTSVRQGEAKRRRQKPGRYPARSDKQPLAPWKLFFVSGVALAIGLAVYGLTDRKDEEHTHDNLPGASTSLLQEIEQLEAIVDSSPQDAQSLVRLANRLQDARFLPRATEYYKRYLALVPKDVSARVDLGICLFESGDGQTAIAEMEKALGFEPLHQLAHLNLGIVNLNLGSVEKANEWFKKCVEINPNTEAGKRAQRILEQHAAIQEPTSR